MIEELLIGIFSSKTLIGILFLLIIALAEIIFIAFAKVEENRGQNLWVYTLLIKISSIIFVIFGFIAIFYVLRLIEYIIPYYKEILMYLGVILIIVLYLYVNKLILKKYMKEIKHTHNFNKGDILECTKEAHYKYCQEDSSVVCNGYKYKFIQNKDYDMIEVESITKKSGWHGKIRTFPDYYFKKSK